MGAFICIQGVRLKGWFDTTGCFALKKMAHGPNKEIGGLGAGPQRYKAAGGENVGLFDAFLLGYVLGIRTGLGLTTRNPFIYEADKLTYKCLIQVNAAARGPCGHASDYLWCTAVALIYPSPLWADKGKLLPVYQHDIGYADISLLRLPFFHTAPCTRCAYLL